METTFDVVVVGGGLSGLTAAAYLGRAGLVAAVVEKARELGGRARTTVSGGFAMNLGAHAVYRRGAAWRILGELGVPLAGGVPSASGQFAVAGSGMHALPTGLLSLVTTGMMPLSGKLEVARLLATLDRIDAGALARVPAIAWIEGVARSPEAQGFLKLFFRVATYSADLERLSAGAAIAQLQLVAKNNVLYLDGGWQTLVDALRAKAEASGAVIVTGDGAASVTAGGEGAEVTLHGGRVLRARAVVLATGPHAAARLAPGAAALGRLAEQAAPVKVATLDVALRAVPRPRARAAFGADRPTYVSLHSAVAKLAPEGGGLVQAMRYGPSGDARADERELEDAIERLQPGWREQVVERRFLPSMIASNDLIAAARGGLAGRPGVAVEGAGGLFVAGDWVGATGMLADAALASAKQAAIEAGAFARGAAERRGQRDEARGAARERGARNEARGAAASA